MVRNLSAYLQDILEACNAIEDVMSGVTLDHYKNRRSVRYAVEREFVIIGEALKRVSALDERLFRSISNSRAAVFGLVYSDLVVLKAEVAELLPDCHDAN